MKKKGLILNSNVYKDNCFITDLLNEDEIFVFEAKGISKIKSKNKSLLLFLNVIEAEFIVKGNKNLLLNGNILYDSSFLLTSYDGIFFLNAVKEILYKLILRENLTKYYNLLLNLIYLCSKYENTNKNIYLISVIYLMLNVFKLEGIDYFSYIDSELNDKKTFDVFLDFKDLSNISLERSVLIRIMNDFNKFIAVSFNSKINSFEIL